MVKAVQYETRSYGDRQEGCLQGKGFTGRTRRKGSMVTTVTSVSLGGSAGLNERGEDGFRDVAQDGHNRGRQREPSVGPGKYRESMRLHINEKKSVFCIGFLPLFSMSVKDIRLAT